MIRSMTGFGEAERDTPAGRLRVQIKTVNHRFFNATVRSPSAFDRFEPQIQAWFREGIARGHVNCSISFDRAASASEDVPTVDVDRARAYLDRLEHLRDSLGLEGPIELSQITRFSDIFRAPERLDEASAVDLESLEMAVREALSGLVSMREAEGGRLRTDLEGRLEALAGLVDTIAARAPARLEAERERLREAIRELTRSEDVDDDRIARETAYIADKWDINEEIVRFRSHLALFRETLDGPDREPVGKRLGFVLQEMHREANTIASKANDTEIAQASMAMKEEIERLREQLENIE